MEISSTPRCIFGIIIAFAISSSFHTHFATASRKRINHQLQTGEDYLGKPQIFGDEYEKAKLSEDNSVAKVKMYQEQPNEANPQQSTQSASTLAPSATATTLPPSLITASLNEEENATLTSPSPSPPTQSSGSTEAISTSTTIEPTTQSTSTATEESNKFIPPEESQSAKGYFCLCDYQVKVCDMNCCCDPDCSKTQKSVFKRCDDDSIIYDPSNQRNKDHTCFKSYIMYQENIPYRIDRSEKSLLCIVKENVQQAQEFSRLNMTSISKRISHGKIDIRPKYTWDTLHEETKLTSFNYEPYKYGSAIWSIRSKIENGEEVSSQEVMYRLPVPFHTDACSILEPVKFLQDSVSRCARPLYNVISQCRTQRELDANHFIKNLWIITNPAKMQGNTTDYEMEGIIPLMWCYPTMSDCTELISESISSFDVINGEDIEFPMPDLEGFITTEKCSYVLSQLNLTFVHEGIQGITKVFAKALLVDVPVDTKQIIQEFKTEFIWNNAPSTEMRTPNDTNTTFMEDYLHLMKLPRSGNPGYIVGKPLILGRKVMKAVPPANDTDGKNKFVEKMHVLPDVSQWLHIQGAGDCPLNFEGIANHSRHPILFGYDHVSSCNLPLEHFNYCGELQIHIASVIFGLTGETNPREFTLSPLYVAAYGSPDAFPSDWVPLTFVDISSLTEESSQFHPTSLFFPPGSNTISSGCGSITTSVHITVSYAYVGPVDSPQAKITGVFYEPEEPVTVLDSSDENRLKNIPITTTVSFLDVTGKPTTRVATFPVVSVQLPADFFYPFSSSTTGPSSGAKKTAKYEYSSLSSSLAFLLLAFGTFIL